MNAVEKLSSPLPDEVLHHIREVIWELREEYETRRFDFFPYRGEGHTVLYRCDRGCKKWQDEVAKIPFFTDPEWVQHYTGRFDTSREIYVTFLQEIADAAKAEIELYVDEDACWSPTDEHYEFIELELAPQTVKALLMEAV